MSVFQLVVVVVFCEFKPLLKPVVNFGNILRLFVLIIINFKLFYKNLMQGNIGKRDICSITFIK